MSAANIRESVKKITPKFAIIVVAIFLALGLVQKGNKLTFTEIYPGDLDRVMYYSVQAESDSDSPIEFTLSAEQGQEVVNLLSELEYQTNGTASSLRFCYCRVFFTTDVDQRQRIELMLTDDMVLVNDIESGVKSKVYRIFPNTDAIQDYINGLAAAN